MTDNYREVTEEEFSMFIKNYPRKLDRNVTQICDPPLVNYNDFSEEYIWPKSIAASYLMGDERTNNKDLGHRIYKYWEK